ncbi:non-ribosomal peptide synthetase, partial [Mycobacterium simiae]
SAALCALEGVDQAVVIAREDRPGDKRLVGYLTGTADITSVRAELATRLPHYMLPAALVVLPALPLTRNGKLDTRALPAPDYTTDHYRAPTSPVEEILATLYSQVLGIDRIGIDDSFFDLGGDSLLAMRAVAAINTTLDADLTVRSLFDTPTIAGLAPHLGAAPHRRTPLIAADRPATIPLSFAQNRLWLLDQLQGPTPVYNIAWALRLAGDLDTEALGAALTDLIARHETLRTVYTASAGIPQQHVLPLSALELGWQVIDATTWPAHQLQHALSTAARHTFHLATQIPLRAQLFRTGEHEHVLVIVVHHIAADGWSLTPLTTDLSAAYASRCAGQAPHWPPLAVQYVDYTLWQRHQLGELTDPDSPITTQLAYWEKTLADMPERLHLPTDRPYPPTADHHGASLTIHWPAALHHQLTHLARDHHATTFMVIHTALTVLLAQLSVSPDIAIGIPVAGRTHPALDHLVGMFVNTLVLRTQLDGDPTLAQLLTQVRTRNLEAFEHQDLPFETLVERLNPTRSTSHHPLIQVLLAWHPPTPTQQLGELDITPLPLTTHTARMDLTFMLAEHFTDTGQPAGITGTVEYRTDIYDTTTITTLTDRLQRLLQTMTDNPDRPLSSIDLLNTAEHAHLEQLGNHTALTTHPTTPPT